ncbi:hypothetical protein IWT140_01711 [Secundilactobacillus pentosiphilus]|uniref:Uncharacterized protein n=1 Tax=Secundilactobacillus pentosiphilus TaxID=1714682 RepID=A0A1Z5IQM6_9LACO|nr:hypothetical protein [Secundilactobacillus pentosiphilus]GAX04074.1 hypothetical protein IWT140_01711 [Secundilactobacillus pentosiphilus]
MDDETVKTIMQQLKALDPELVEDVSPDAFKPLVERANFFVQAYNPPESAYSQLLLLATGAIIDNFDGDALTSVKINNIQINADTSISGNPWLHDFKDLLNALGLYEAKVTGF